LAHTLTALAQVPELSGLLLAIAPADGVFESAHPGLPVGGWQGLTAVQQRAADTPAWLHVARCAGESRAHTVLNGLRVALAELGATPADWVLVHDAARCLVRPQAVSAFIRDCQADAVGGLMAIPLPDTLKQATQGRVAATVPRHDKWLAQTPQMFRLGALLQALEAALPTGFGSITDESSAMEQQGHAPLLVLGSPDNIKLTFPPDFALAESILKERQP
jgi:2-C-methyl-D-erythritol 4-phosphate cytidylyltransferase